jgi:Ca2+-binding EF-hand superfamily protein
MRPLPKSQVATLLRSLGRPLTQLDADDLMAGVPDIVEFKGFCQLLEQAADKQVMWEDELCKVLSALDLTGQGSLDPGNTKHLLTELGDRMQPKEVDQVLAVVPLNGQGRIPCRMLARRLIQGPETGIVRV